jgi:pyruvate/2-oxoglutarate dehydrogenase complex dihydrolipoamide acyltransferase (E2) component
MQKIKLPELGEGIKSAELAFWHVKEGDTINNGDDICEVVTNKVSFHVESPFSGILSSIKFKEQDCVKIGEVIAYIEEE